MDKDLQYKIALTLIPDIGDVRAKNLIAFCGSVEAVFREKRSALKKIPGVGDVIARSVSEADMLERAEEEMRFIERYGIQPLFYLDDSYPRRLKHCEDSPVMLYYKGSADLNAGRIVSIVGSRACTDYGKGICTELIAGLAELNVMVVSGLAYGMDICAHKAALRHELDTVGVLAHGLDMLYPSVHKATAKKMVARGGLLTEFPSMTKMHPDFFPRRNRIVAGMSDAVIVIEAAKKSGSLITAHLANDYNRDVFAVPGRLTDPVSEGCNFLIKANKAALIQSVQDIIYIMGWEEKKKGKTVQKQLFVQLSPDEEALVNILREKGKINIDELSLLAGLPMSKTATALLSLEFSGLVRSLPGKVYQLS
ncbi:MAG: DNA-processing protein DprA [Bacteroidota bacterium]